jgi:hypothetical protein
VPIVDVCAVRSSDELGWVRSSVSEADAHVCCALIGTGADRSTDGVAATGVADDPTVSAYVLA